MATPYLNIYIPSFKPISNIQPFTYRDGATYLEVLESLRTFVNNYLVDWINTNLNGLADGVELDINELIEQINTSLDAHDASIAQLLENQTEANDTAIAALTTLVNTAVGNMNNAVDEVNTAITNHTTETTTYVTTQIAGLTTYVNAQVESILEASIEVNDAVMYAVINDSGSDTRQLLDLLFNNASATDAGTAANVVDAGSLTRAALNANFTEKAVEAVVNSGRLSEATLDADILGVANASAAAAVGAINHDSIVTALVNNVVSALRVKLDSLYEPNTPDNKWRAWRPIMTNWTPGIDSTVDGRYYFDGVMIHVELIMRAAVGATGPMGTDPSINTPSTMDVTDLPAVITTLGSGTLHDATTGITYSAQPIRPGTGGADTVIIRYLTSSLSIITSANPFSWGILDGITLKFSYIPVTKAAPKNFLAYGDSISRFETNSGVPAVWPLQVAQAGLTFGGGWAKDAATTAQILAGAKKLNADIAVNHSGVNDIANAVPQATTLANIVSLKNKVQADKFMVMKLAPYNTNPSAIVSINNAMTAWAAANGMILIDPWLAYRAAGNAGQWAAGAHNGDGVHPTSAVQTAVAGLVRTAILANI